MPFVCTGKLVADGKRYAHGEVVPSAVTWAPHQRAMLIRSGALSQVSDAEAKSMSEHHARLMAVDKLRNLEQAHKLASQQAQTLEAESKALEASLVALKAKLESALKAAASAHAELVTHSKANQPAVAVVRAGLAPRVAPVEPVEVKPAPPSEDDERRILMAQSFAPSRGDLIAKAKAEGIDLSKMAKAKKEDVQVAYVNAVMARKHKAAK